MTDREALREKVARLYIDKWGLSDYWLADAAINLVMGEAAKIASEWKVSITGVEPISNKHASRIASSVGPHIAAALRAYIKEVGK